MEPKLNKLLVPGILLTFSLISCEKIDIKGMFISGESVNQRFEQSMIWNKDNPARTITVTSDEYEILSFADCHTGETSDLDKVLKTAKRTNVTAVVMVGDLTTGSEKDYSVFQKHLPDRDSLNSFLIAGNHDLWFDGWDQFYSRFGSSTYFFTIKTPLAKDLFICLDSGSGTLGNKQLKWLRYNLQVLRPGYRKCIVFTHDNFFRNRHTSSTNPVVEEVAALLGLFTEYKVDLVIAGHDHKQNSETFGNTTYIIMDALLDGLENSGYLRINMLNGKLKYNFVNL